METIDLRKLVGPDEGAFVSVVVGGSETMVVLTWALGPRRRMPELTFSRSDVLYLVLEGTLHVVVGGPDADRDHQVQTGQALVVPKQTAHRLHNQEEELVRVVLVRTPGPARFEDLGLGRIECPVCLAALPIEKGDRSGDRFVCSDCAFRMKLDEHEGLLRPTPFEPERFDG